MNTLSRDALITSDGWNAALQELSLQRHGRHADTRMAWELGVLQVLAADMFARLNHLQQVDIMARISRLYQGG